MSRDLSLFTAATANDLIDQLFQAPVERHVLPNGLTLVHRPDYSSEVVSVQVWVKTGSIHEDALIGSGLSHFLEHMLFKGTERRDGKSISREVHAIGGSINAYTTFDRTVYYINAPSTAFDTVLDVLSDIVLHSTLPEDEVNRERDVILREIDMGLDDPDRQLTQALFRTAFQRHPYREPVIGHRELFEKVTHAELFAYYKSRYVPNNIVVSVAGAVHPDRVQEKVEASFGSVLRGRLAPVQIEQEPIQLAPRREDIVGAYNVFRGGMGFKVPHLSHPDSPKLDALAHALGGGESSLLWQRLRNEAKLVHYIDCRSWSPGAAGLFWISYVCDPEEQGAVEGAVLELIESVNQEGLDASVVDKARRQALSSEINGRKTMSGQASRLGLGEVVLGDLLYGRRYLKRLQEIQPGDLQEVSKRYLIEAGLSSVTLGPKPESADNEKPLADVLSPEPFQFIEYTGGGRLLHQLDRKLPKVHLRCVLRAGPLFEPANQRGISELLAELLTKDTEIRTAADISHLIDGIGGSFSATGGNNTLSLAIEVLPGDLPIALDLLEAALTTPIFDEATFETERDSQVAELKESDDEILDYGFRKLRESFYGAHPFSVSAEGRVEDLEALTVSDLRAYYSRIVKASNVVLSVCGDFDQDSLEARCAKLFESKLPKGSIEVITSAFSGPESAVDTIVPMEREQAVVLQAFPDVGLLDDDYVVSEVLNELFSGMSSQLFERVREDKGMAYYVGSSRVVGLDQSMFVFYAGTHPARATEVHAEIDLEVARVKAGEVSAEELERCRTRLKAARPMGKQTIGARAMNAAINLTYGQPIDDDAEHAAKLDAVNAEALAVFAQKHFDGNKRVALKVGPESLRSLFSTKQV